MRFLQSLITLAWFSAAPYASAADFILVDDFERANSLYHGHQWESLNPGYWKVQDGALRRRLTNVGNRNPITHFPWHWSSGGQKVAPRTGDRTPNLPLGMVWRQDWNLSGNFTVRATFTVHDLQPKGRGEPSGFMGICFGGESWYESLDFDKARPGAASWMALWHKDGRFGLFDHLRGSDPVNQKSSRPAFALEVDVPAQVEIQVSGASTQTATITATLRQGERAASVTVNLVDRTKYTDGFFGLVGYGALDFEVGSVEIAPEENKVAPFALNELHVCYPLGDTLKLVDGRWVCKFIALFRSDGQHIDIRVADSPQPRRGWQSVPVAGSADLVDNDWRRYTAVVEVALPVSPAEKTLYYTVWKDDVDVTADPRPAEPSRGYLGRKMYVGRLPRLTAPYRVCTLGGHALFHGGTTLPRTDTYQANWIHGQPTENAYRHFEEYNFQIINWDDDVWYLELLFPPPSTDDAYKIVNLTIGNPTTRWKMMRHWNVINPGDHDYGMDDIKGPEQILVRRMDDLGQDSEYMRRNYSINQHLVEGRETPVRDENLKDWRLWKMPNGDFTLIVLEARFWRTSQDTNLWVNNGWGHKRALYDRRDPTRTLLGEEQFAWLTEVVRSETAPLILLTGVNCMHPVFTGFLTEPGTNERFANEDRVAADYSGWVTAGVDRLLEVLGGRPGIISVYGDIHLASIVENAHHRIIESSCGPIGRGGSRGLKHDWATRMKDYDGRDVHIRALYHREYDTPELRKRQGPPHWNFLEKEFDPRGKEPRITLKIRNIIDAPSTPPRGGGVIDRPAATTGRQPACSLPEIVTLPNADVYLRTLEGRPVIATRSLQDGSLWLNALADVEPGTRLLITATDGRQTSAQIVVTAPLSIRGKPR